MPQLNEQLRADEKVLWSGKPVRIRFMLNSLVAIVIGVLLMGVGIFEFIVWSELFFLIPIFIGFVFIFGATLW